MVYMKTVYKIVLNLTTLNHFINFFIVNTIIWLNIRYIYIYIYIYIYRCMNNINIYLFKIKIKNFNL